MTTYSINWAAQNGPNDRLFQPYTLDSGIDVAPGITVAPPLKNFHIMILILFYINLGIAVIFY